MSDLFHFFLIVVLFIICKQWYVFTIKLNEQQHDKTNKMTCEDSDKLGN